MGLILYLCEMAKAPKKPVKKRQKRTIDVDTKLTFEQALKLASNTPPPKKKK